MSSEGGGFSKVSPYPSRPLHALQPVFLFALLSTSAIFTSSSTAVVNLTAAAFTDTLLLFLLFFFLLFLPLLLLCVAAVVVTIAAVAVVAVAVTVIARAQAHDTVQQGQPRPQVQICRPCRACRCRRLGKPICRKGGARKFRQVYGFLYAHRVGENDNGTAPKLSV